MFCIRIGLLALALCASECHVQILLKPKGENAAPLRVKALNADVKISGQFAATALNYTFQNETSERIEADFIYTVPPHAVVTYFAYWYGDEKVVARVVEKERAATIYKYITSRMRDPALVEMIGKNTFRARIFPVMPNADLKVEVHLAQTLESEQSGAFYDLALRGPEAGKGTFDALDVNVQVQSDATLAKVADNLALPVTKDDDGFHLSLSQRNFLPSRDLRVRLIRAPRSLQAALYAARSGGSDGFFALALTPNKALAKPRVKITGVATYELAPAALAGVPAHGTLVVTGRYKGSGPATVTLLGSGQTYSTKVNFDDRVESNHLATKLWAAQRIEALSASPRNRTAVIALSKRFTLPSKFTSWLAVPQEERERFQQEMAQAELAVVGRRIAMEFAAGRGKGRTAKQLRRNFNAVAAKTGAQPSEALPPYFDVTMRVLASQLAREKYSARPAHSQVALLKRQITRLQRAGAGRDSNSAEPIYIVEEDMRELGRQILEEIQRGQGEGKRAKALRAALQKMEGRSQKVGLGWNAKAAIQDVAAQRLPLIEHELENEQTRQRPDAKRIAELQQRHDRVAKLVPPPAPPQEARWGDPLISIEAPADAAQVIAMLPDGVVKLLAFNARSGRWEARFDIPTYAPEGDFPITVVIVDKDGARRTLKLNFRVDGTAPHGKGTATAADGGKLRLELDANDDTARVAALLPWGAKIELAPSTQRANGFFAVAEIPTEFRGAALQITYVVTDRAHNRTTLTVDMED